MSLKFDKLNVDKFILIRQVFLLSNFPAIWYYFLSFKTTETAYFQCHLLVATTGHNETCFNRVQIRNESIKNKCLFYLWIYSIQKKG